MGQIGLAFWYATEINVMKIIIATGIYPPAIGGPAQYAKNLAEEFTQHSHRVRVLMYKLENYLPTGVRHLCFFLKMLLALPGVDFILALDTFSVGWPAVLAAKLCGKKIIIRTGGDFLWEGYVERTGDLVLLREFYQTRRDKWNGKERLIFKLTRWTLKNCSAVVFSSKWQKEIWLAPYELSGKRLRIIENCYG